MRIDEKIALLEKEHRMQAKLEQEAAEQGIEEPVELYYTVEELRKKMETGRVLIGLKNILMEERIITKGNLRIPFMTGFFDVIDENEDFVWYASNYNNVTLTLSRISEKKTRTELSEWASFLKKEMKGNQLYMDVQKTERMEHLDYVCFETPTSKGHVYNVIFQLCEEEQYFVGTYNCQADEKKTMGVFLEALVQEINDRRNQ